MKSARYIFNPFPPTAFIEVISASGALNLLHAMRLYIGACVTEVNCEADHFLERHWNFVSCYFQVRVRSTYLKEAALDNY